MNLPKSVVHSLDMTRYAETFEVFVRHSLEYDQILSAIRDVVSHLPKGYAMLDVGAGTGEVIHALVNDAGFPPAIYVGYEPNAAHFASLTMVIKALGLKDVHLLPDPFDDTVSLDAQFDFVLFSHSLYWMQDPPAVLHHAVKSLKSGGVAMGILQGPYGVHTLLNLFNPRFERLTPILQNNMYSSYELLLGLRSRGLRPHCRMMATPLDVTGLFKPDRQPALSELLSFCLQVEFDALDPDLRQDIIDFVEGAAVPMGEKSLWFIPNAVVTVST